ncbi:MAG: GNAT family N-acetyltransferase [Ilumatobacter sp.]|uniref:GNAT family N-acetyltransferase n=1 Tax=Ilumatobacter sp. TaxID=1967498 RepID=UPI003C7870B9
MSNPSTSSDSAPNESILRLRDATPADASSLALLADAATRRLMSWRWDARTEPGQSGFEVGRTSILSDVDQLNHHSRWRVAERDGLINGAINSYLLESAPSFARSSAASSDRGDPDGVLAPLTELKAIAAGTWYVSIASVFPESRGQGVGRALLAEADRLASASAVDRVSLIVASFNPRAKLLYEDDGYGEAARCPFHPFPGSDPGGDWILMIKHLSRPA